VDWRVRRCGGRLCIGVDRAAVTDALLDAIVRGLADRVGRTRDQNFVALGTKVLTKGDILVRSEFRRPLNRPTSVDWRVRRCGGRLCIGDVLVDGGSLTVQQRDRVAQRLAGNGGSIPALVADIRKGRL
jgi:ABC-type transporter MlaC component